MSDNQPDPKSWEAEAKALREGMAKLAEAFGWADVRQESGDLHLPCAEDIIEVARKVRLNSVVSGKLTQAGAAHYRGYVMHWRNTMLAQGPDLPEKYLPQPLNVGDVYESTLWEMMNIFGQAMRHGEPALFEGMVIYLRKQRT